MQGEGQGAGCMERKTGAQGYPDFFRLRDDAVPVFLFYDDSVFQCRNSYGAAVYRSGADPGLSVYQGQEKAESI